MKFKVEFCKDKMKIITSEYEVEDVLGNITCRLAEREWDALSLLFPSERRYGLLKQQAMRFLESCFYSKAKTDKVSGYMLMDEEMNLSEKQYTVSKVVAGSFAPGEASLNIADVYHLNSIFELMRLEMLYAVMNDMSIMKCGNCGKYFAAVNSASHYCDRVFDGSRTCRQLGAKKIFNNNLKLDNALLKYEKAYQATYYRWRNATREKDKSDLNIKLIRLKTYRLEYKRGKISAERFLQIIEEILNELTGMV